jgi:predicted TPR repeat methyltransferase
MDADRLDAAISLHLAGQLAEAEAAYRAILQATPDSHAAMHYLGVLLHQQQRGDEGIEFVRASLRSPDAIGDWHNTLGNMLVDRGRDEEAIASFMNALQIDARHRLAWNNLGAVLLRRGQTGDAILAFQSAVAIDAEFEDALHNLADAFTRASDDRSAAHSRCAAYVLRPTPDKPRHMLGLAYRVLGRLDDAAKVYEAWLIDSPGDPIASHLLMACREGATSGRASDAYLARYFDEFSESFEQKLSKLAYSVPERLGDALGQLGLAPHSLRILDAGCGTGLCGPQLAPYASRLTGVDLSAKSLAVAAAKGLYAELHQRELVDHMASSPGAAFDLVVAADTLIYFGDLEKFMHAASRVLAPSGLLIASFQEIEPHASAEAAQAGFAIEPSGRFSHSRAYLLERHEAAGFSPPAIRKIDIRLELGLPVEGVLTVARKR